MSRMRDDDCLYWVYGQKKMPEDPGLDLTTVDGNIRRSDRQSNRKGSVIPFEENCRSKLKNRDCAYRGGSTMRTKMLFVMGAMTLLAVTLTATQARAGWGVGVRIGPGYCGPRPYYGYYYYRPY